MDYFAVACTVLFVGMWIGFSVLGLKKTWSSVISIGGGFIASLLSMFPFLFSYAVFINQESVLYASITLLSIIPVGWAWILIFRIKSTSSGNRGGGAELISTKLATQQTNDGIPETGVTPENDPNRERILRELKRHEEHYDKATCLDCGYEGIAGVVGKKVPWYVTWWVIVPLCFTGIGIFGGLILGLIRASQVKVICECPKCGSNSLIG